MEENFLSTLENIDAEPEGSTSLMASAIPIATQTTKTSLRAKLESLNELLVDECIKNLASGKIKANDLGAIVTLLKNNKVVEERREESESDVIDGLIA
jgi:methionyl-tRNA formyltransferase